MRLTHATCAVSESVVPICGRRRGQAPESTHHFMARRVARLVEIDHTGADEGFEVPLQRSTSHRNWREMSSSDKKSIVILEEQWPVAGIDCWGGSFGLDSVVHLLPFGRNDCHLWKRLDLSDDMNYCGRFFIIIGIVERWTVCRFIDALSWGNLNFVNLREL